MRTPQLHAQLTTCPRCNSAILTALDHPVAGLTTRVDPLPLTAEDELSARLAGRLTYNLIGSPLLARYQLAERDETNIHKPETSPERESETPEDPQNVEDLPDIWPELSAMWARQPSDARTNHCRNFAEDATSELTVRMWKLLYAEETGEEADADDVAIVLRWVCSDVSID